MARNPYGSAKRVFWIVENGTSHRGAPCAARLLRRWPTILPVPTPVHASWLTQAEIYLSIAQRKALTPSDFSSLAELEHRRLAFQRHYEQVAKPFEWKFTRQDLAALMVRLQGHEKLPLIRD